MVTPYSMAIFAKSERRHVTKFVSLVFKREIAFD